jgi:acyl-CoA dehydrogenase
MPYTAPLNDMQFVMEELAGLDAISKLPAFQEATPDLVAAILDEAAKFSSNVLAPLNRTGDTVGAKRAEDGSVKTPPGFKDAYLQFAENGWNGLTKSADFGGQGLPRLVGTAVEEMQCATNMAFALCPMLTQGAIESVELCGTEEQKQAYLPKMVAGTWTGTMNLTEPQAGSDLAAVRTKAVPQPDGSYKVYGQKIFITYGEHDYTENIIHLVLARLPDAPEGVKGISLFIVPKFLLNADGSPGKRNDVQCVSLEHKLGIHASPTAVLAFGDQGGAVGYLIGEANRGLEYMFIMMNLARFSVGMQGVGLAEGAYQLGLAYAKERVQGKAVGTAKGAKAGPIIHHPDVQRMLMSMKAQTEAMRAIAYVTAAALDMAHAHPDPTERARYQAFSDLMIAVVKGWCTEKAQQVTYDAVQVHGGMGFIEETGAAQYYRDARIITIYEGTTGIQAQDLVGRKVARDKGKAAFAIISEMERLDGALSEYADNDFSEIRAQLRTGVNALKGATEWVVATFAENPRAVLAGSVPYLELWGIVAGGWQMARAALAAQRKLDANAGDAAFNRSKIKTARFFADFFVAHASALKHTITVGAEGLVSTEAEVL